MVGRTEELGLLKTLAQQEAGVVLAGDPGVGKSRLASEAVNWAKEEGWAVSLTMATEQLRDVPFGALAHLFGPHPEPGLHPFSVAEQALRDRRDASRARCLMLIIDDCHLVDKSSQALIQHIARAGEVFVLATLRTGGPGGEWLVPLWKDGILHRVDLRPLSRAEVQTLTGEVMGRPVESTLMSTLWRITQGNPLYLREVLLDAVEQNALAVESGVLHSPAGLAPKGGRLRDVVAARLGNLSASEQFAIDLLAICGPLEHSQLELLADEAAVLSLEDRGVLEVAAGGPPARIRLAHPLYGEMRRASMPMAQRRSVVRALDTRGIHPATHPSLYIPVARCKLALGDDDAQLFLHAALELRDHVELAIRASIGTKSTARDRHAIEPTPNVPADEHPQRLVLRLALASLRAGGGYPAGLLALTTATQLADQQSVDIALTALRDLAHDDRTRAEVASHHAMSVLLLHGDRDGAERILDEAMTAAHDPTAGRTLRLNRIRLTAIDTMDREVTRQIDHLLRDRDLERAHRGEALAFKALALGVQGNCDRSLAAVDMAVEILGSLPPGAHMGVVDVLSNKIVTYLFAGRLDDLRRVLPELVELTQRHAAPSQRAELALGAGEHYLCRGDLASAEREFVQAITCYVTADYLNVRAWAYASLAYTRMHRGDIVGADEALRSMESAPLLHAWLRPYVVRASAWRTALRGDSYGARQMLRSGVLAEISAGRLPQAAMMLHDVSRLAFFKDSLSLLQRLDHLGYDGIWLPSMIGFAEAGLHHDGGGLDDAALGFERIGCLIWAAEAAALAATAHTAAGLAARARAAAVRCSTLTTMLNRPTSPLLAQADVPPVLTRREREIVRLAAKGMTDSRIADQLVLSVRTVQTHLHNAYAKLGVAGRHDLKEVLGASREEQ